MKVIINYSIGGSTIQFFPKLPEFGMHQSLDHNLQKSREQLFARIP
jgi:hypothetical protein